MNGPTDPTVALHTTNAIQQSAVYFFLCDRNGRFVAVNDALCEASGYSRAELMGMDMSVFDIPGDHSRAASARSQLALGGLEHWRRRRPVRRKDGTVIWIDLAGNAVRDEHGELLALAGFALDVTSEVDAQTVAFDIERGTARDLVVRAVAGASIGQAVLSLDGEFVEANPALCLLLGRSRTEVLGRQVADFIHESDRVADTAARRRLLSGVPASATLDLRLARPDGTPVWVRSFRSCVPDSDGAPAWVVEQVLDVSAEKSAQERAAAAEADLRFRSEHDPLTGLLNRDSIVARLDRELASGSRVAAFYLDVDRFKEINDGISHAAGDAVLQEIATRLQASLRRSDVVGRIGGDEFVAVLPDVFGDEHALRVARMLRESIAARPIRVANNPIWVTISIGVALSDPTRDAGGLLQEADTALHEAKRSGRDRWSLFDGSMRVAMMRRLEVAAQIRAGLSRAEFQAWYQPQVDLTSGTVIGHEALARWVAPGAPVVSAEAFIDVAEDRGLIPRIGSRVMADAVTWAAARDDGLRMAVNASPQEISAPGFERDLDALLTDQRLPGDRLILEITEGSLLGNTAATRATLSALADRGVTIHVDDFGTGYSSLSHLLDFPIKGVKLDRSFTARLSADDDRGVTGMVAGIADLAERLGLERIAEGVETPEQSALLMELGWNHGQGWLFSPAVPGEDLMPTAPGGNLLPKPGDAAAPTT